jgi:hypothetical protein
MRKYFTYTVCDSRKSIVASEQYEGRDAALQAARFYASELHGTSITVRSPSGRVVARETVDSSVSVTQS